MTQPPPNLGDLPKDARFASTVSSLQDADQETIARNHTADTRGLLENINISFVDIILGGFNTVVSLVGNLLSDLAKALFGGYDGSNESLLVISDGMTQIRDRVDLLSKVSGFGVLVMKDHHKFEGGNNFLRVPFDEQYGPMKNCSFDQENNRLVLNKGTWTLTPILASSSGSTLLGQSGLHGKVVVLDPAGNVFIEQYLDFFTFHSGLTASVPVPVVCPEDGFTVSVMFRHSALWWTLWGGVNRTKLVANRWDIDASNSELPTNTANPENPPAITQDSQFNVP